MSELRTDLLMIVNKYCQLDIADDSVRSTKVGVNKMLDEIVSQVEVKPEIAEGIKKKKQEYLRWLTLPRYQKEISNEYYADIQAITEDLQGIIDFIESNFEEVKK